MTSASDIMRFRRRFGASGEDAREFFAISTSNSLQKSSAIQKISVTLLSVIMIFVLKFDTSKLLNISDITKRIGNFFKLPIQLSWGIAYPELASIVSLNEEANNTISEYEAKFDKIQSDASDGYDAISYFNCSYELQEALDAFENIQSEASY